MTDSALLRAAGAAGARRYRSAVTVFLARGGRAGLGQRATYPRTQA
jgi:hypothetical protein